MEHKEYKISNQTIKDIINNIPKDKWTSVISDLQECLNQAGAVMELIGLVAKESGLDTSEILDMGDTITWIDDGKCENEFNFVDQEGNQQGNIKFGENGVEVK